jgi:hypothetical protein
MMKNIVNKLAEAATAKAAEMIGSTIKAAGRAAEAAPSKVQLYATSSKLCWKLGQLEGLNQAIQNKSTVSEMETRIALINLALEKGRGSKGGVKKTLGE